MHKLLLLLLLQASWNLGCRGSALCHELESSSSPSFPLMFEAASACEAEVETNVFCCIPVCACACVSVRRDFQKHLRFPAERERKKY